MIMGMLVLMCDHWPLELAVNGHWYCALVVRRLRRLLKLAVKEIGSARDRAPYVRAAK